MKVSKEQIDQLFTFTSQHYVEWYDLQSELVDHLANAIEAQWEEYPNRSFDEVLKVEFSKFGVFGFMDVVEKRQFALSKKYNGLVWQYLKDFFTVPKIILTIVITLLLFSILKIIIYKEEILLGFYFILICYLFYGIFRSKQKAKLKKQSKEKKWMFEDIINNYGIFSTGAIFVFNIMIQATNYSQNLFVNDYWLLGVSFISVIIALLIFIIVKIIPSNIEEYLKITYPEYKLE